MRALAAYTRARLAGLLLLCSGSSLAATALLCAGCVESNTYTPEAPTRPVLRLPMNDSYLGSVHADPTRTLRPHFVWEPSKSASRKFFYQLQFSTDREFAGSVQTVETEKTSYQPEEDLEISRVPPVGARYYWRVRACAGKSCSDYTRARYVNVGRVPKDYNGDGYADLAVGAPSDSSHLPNAGRIYVYFGGPGRFDTTDDGTLGDAGALFEGSFAGNTVQSAGDLNGDGYADLALSIGARPQVDPPQLYGHVYLFYGGPEARFDGTVDSKLSTAVANDGFALAAGGLGDLNGDGFGDLFVTSAKQLESASRVDVYFGSSAVGVDARPDATISSSDPFLSACAAGDVNGDGFADMLVGDPSDSTAGVQAGAAHLYLGGEGPILDASLDDSLGGLGVDDRFGFNVATAGDVNGDGFADVLVASLKDELFNQPGNVHLFLGSHDAFADAPSASFRGGTEFDGFGWSLAGAGDVNGDGLDDILIGANHTSDLAGNAGRAYLYLGSATTPYDNRAALVFSSSSVSAYFGERVSLGDINGDGLHDLAISADNENNGAGKVDLFLSSGGAMPDTVPEVTLHGAAASYAFGEGLALASPHSSSTPRRSSLAARPLLSPYTAVHSPHLAAQNYLLQ